MAQGIPAGEEAFNKGRHLYDCSLFYEASDQLQIAAKAFGDAGQLDQQLSALFLLESAYDMTFENERRRQVLDQLLRITNRKLGEYHPLHHKALVQEADYFYDIAQSAKASSLLTPLMPRFREHNDYWSLSSGHLLLGRCFQKKLDQFRAREEYETALEICQEYLPNDTTLHIFVLDRLGYYFSRIGHARQAAAYCQQRMDLLLAKPSFTARDSLEVAKCHLAFAETYRLVGDPDLGTEHAEEALRLFRVISISHRRFIGEAMYMSITGGSRFYNNPDQFARYNSVALQADPLLKAPTDKYMALNQFLNNLFFIKKGNQPEKNWERIEEMHRLSERWNINPQTIYVKSCLVELATGNAEEALRYGKLSLQKFYQEYGMEDRTPRVRGFSHLVIGIAFLQLVEFDSAASYLHLACQDFTMNFRESDIGENPSFHHGYSEIHLFDAIYYKGLAFLGMAKRDRNPKKLQAAFDTHLGGIAFIDSLRNSYIDQRAKLDLSANLHRLCEGVIRSGLSLYASTGDTLYLNRAFWASEMGKSQLLMETWTRSRSLRTLGIPDRDLAVEDSLKKELIFFEGVLLDETTGQAEQDDLLVDRIKGSIQKVKSELRRWEEDIESRFPGILAQWNQKIVPTPSQIQESLLGPDENLVTYFVGEEEIYCFLISKKEVKGVAVPKPDNFEAVIQDYLQSIGNYQFVTDSVEQGFRQYTTSAHQLYEWLLRPLFPTEALPAKLLVIPDAILTQIPFEALLPSPVGENEFDYLSLPYLLRNTQMHYGFSVAFLWGKGTPKRETSSARCLAIAPGGMDGEVRSLSGNLPKLRSGEAELQGTQDEVGMIANLGITGRFLLGDSANEPRFKELAPEFEVLHLATHGMADQSTPDRSSLRFAPVDGDTTGDHFLYAYELDGVDLNAELVVLSACESGVGKQFIGEGPMSLGRGFLANGVSSVVMTLWRVEDQASSKLMQSFYQYLVEEVPVGDALYQAKLDALKHADSRTAHPYYWAGYISNGISKPLSFEQESDGRLSWYLLLLGAFAMGVLVYWLRKGSKRNGTPNM